MARMVPFPALPTQSSAERRLYEGFLRQLDDAYVVYHSVDWLLAGEEGPIQGEADFVITHPEHGLLVLEAKGGRLEYDPAKRTWTQAGRTGSHRLDKDPFAQAEREMTSLEEILSAKPGWVEWKPSRGYGVALPDTTYDRPAHREAPTEIVIDRRHLDALAERVGEIMAFHRRPGGTFGATGMDAVAEVLGFRIEVRMPLGVPFSEEDKKIVQLTDEQAWVRNWITKLRRAAVVGPAGCGKTMIAIEIARRMAEGGTRTLLTCFNEHVARHLRRCTEGTPHLDVVHLDALAHDIVAEAGLAPPEDRMSGEGLPSLMQEAAERTDRRYGAMVVDEAQEIGDEWWPALLSLQADPDEGRLYLFADEGEAAPRGAVPGVIPRDACFSLPENVRATKEIGDFVSVFHRGKEAPLSTGPEGRPVEVLGYKDDEDLASTLRTVLANLTEEEGILREEIAVLTPSTAATSRLRQRPDLNGFPLSEDPRKGEILATSVHAFKGLECPVVILAELGEEHLEDLDHYLYLGGSRARDHLIILAADDVAKRLREMARRSAS